MKTTLVKEKIRQAVIDYKIEELRLNSQPSGSLISQHEQALETATQAIQKLVDEECIKARINELTTVIPTLKMETECEECVYNEDLLNDRVTELTATESPLKPVKEEL